ncbi:MAG: hypothetical protein AB2A00_40080, partial [Myxococcota bacterium]
PSLSPSRAVGGTPPPVRVSQRRQLDCLWVSAAAAAVVTFPTVIPLWVGGVAKGLITYTLVADVLNRTSKQTGLTSPPWLTPQGLEALMILVAGTGALLNVGLNMPSFVLLATGTINQVVVASEGLGTGACTKQTPRRVENGSLAVIPLLFALSVVPAPLTVVPLVLGTILVLTSMGILPAMPWIPALGFVDREFAIKRAGLLTSATYPAWWISANLAALGALHGIFWLWARANIPTSPGPVE